MTIPLSILLLAAAIATPLHAAASDPVTGQQQISDGVGGLPYPILDAGSPFPEFGASLARLGDFDGDGVPDVVVGIPRYVATVGIHAAVDILLLNTDGTVKDHHLLKHTLFEFALGDTGFGQGVTSLGDLDGDGVTDLAIGLPDSNFAGGASFDPRGLVWIAFLNADGTLKAKQAVGEGYGGFTGTIGSEDEFGYALTALGDLDGDGVTDLAVGAPGVDPAALGFGGTNKGRVWILFLNGDGTVKAHATIDDVQLPLGVADGFGAALADLGDLDGDGTIELAVGAPRDTDGGPERGVVWILSVDAAGAVTASGELGTSTGIVGLDDQDHFGTSLAAIGDWNDDGIGADLAVGAPLDDDGGNDRGAVHMLTLKFDGTVQTQTKISDTVGGFTGTLGSDQFGAAVAMPGDLDGDGNDDLAAGAPFGGVGNDKGAVWNLFLDSPLPPFWVDLGKSLVGTPGFPELIGTGPIQAGQFINVILRDALPNALASLVFGLSPINAPFKGGTLVPTPSSILSGFNTGPSGVVTLGTSWPSGVPAGFDFYTQWWVVDPGGPLGLSATNALKGISQ